MTSPFTSSFPLKELQIEQITVFYEDSLENLLTYFPKSEAKAFVQLLQETQIHPQKTYSQILSWKTKHSKNPLLDNLLTFSLLQNKKTQEAEELIVESYHNYPDYLFAKINYADQCLRKKRWDQIPLIFPNFDLSALLPQKHKFHVSEFRGFMILACRYHLKIRKKDLAKRFYQNAYLADPSHPSLVLLEKELFASNWLRKSLILFFKFFKITSVLLSKVRQIPSSNR